jgi:hypothetical protein
MQEPRGFSPTPTRSCPSRPAVCVCLCVCVSPRSRECDPRYLFVCMFVCVRVCVFVCVCVCVPPRSREWCPLVFCGRRGLPFQVLFLSLYLAVIVLWMRFVMDKERVRCCSRGLPIGVCPLCERGRVLQASFRDAGFM